MKGSIPGLAGEVEIFFGNSVVFDAFGANRTEMAARALATVNIGSFKFSFGSELVETDTIFPEPGIDARFSRRFREEGIPFFNPFTNGFQSDAQIPRRLGFKIKLVPGLGGSVGPSINLLEED